MPEISCLAPICRFNYTMGGTEKIRSEEGGRKGGKKDEYRREEA
jgi:hypothetical protein